MSYPPTTLKLIAKTVATVPVTALSLLNLNLDINKRYLLINRIKNVSGGGISCKLEVNGDTTATNYYKTYFYRVTGAAFTSGESNDGVLQEPPAGYCEGFFGYLQFDLDGRPCLRTINHASDGTHTVAEDQSWLYKNAVTSITQLVYTSSVANSLGAGSEMAIYELV